MELGGVEGEDVGADHLVLRLGGEDEGAVAAGDTDEFIADEDGRRVEGLAAAAGTHEHTFAIDVLAGFGVDAGGEPLVVDDVEVAVFEDGRGDVAAGVAVPQYGVGGGVTLAAEFDGDAARGGKAAEEVGFVAIGHEAGGDIAGEAVLRIPAELAGGGIHAPKLLWHGDDEIGDAVVGVHIWRAVGHAEFSLGFPRDLAGLFVEADDGLGFIAGIDDHEVTHEHGAGSGAPAGAAGTGAAGGLPELLAGHVKGQRSRFAEEDIHALAIGDGGLCGVAVLGDVATPWVLLSGGGHLGFPEGFAIGLAQAEEMPGEL